MNFGKKLLCIILIGLLVQGFMSFLDITQVFGQPSITLKWRKNAGTSSTCMGPLAADLNNDGLMEIVITGENGVAAVNPIDGSVIWSAPYGGFHCPFEIIDLNKDGIPEILLNTETPYRVVALHGNNGSVYWINTAAAGDGNYMAVADINADGYPEIYCAIPGKVTALTYDGRIFARTYTYYTCYGGMTVGDTDFDGVFEVYLGERSESYPSYPSGGRGLRAFWADNLTEIWAHPDILCSSQAPVLADVDKDGDLEIIILHQRKGIAVINTDGSVNTYNSIYRKQLSISALPSNGHSNPTVADVDGDGKLELIQCGSASGDWYNPAIWDLVDWKLDATLPFTSKEPPGVADIDGDGGLEIIAPNQRNVTIFKYNKAAAKYDIVYTIPLSTASPFFIAQDIDNDGKLELVFNQYNSWISVYDVETPAPAPLPRSGLCFYSEYRTRVPVYVSPPDQLPKISEISPNDGATNVSITLSELSFKLTDYQNDPINYTVITNPNVGSASGINVPNGKITVPLSGLAYSTTYAWTVTATDGTHTMTRTLTFKTELPPAADDIIFDSNFDMGNLINVTYQDAAPGYRYYKAAVNYTIGTDPAHTGYSARTNNDKHWWFYFSMKNVAGKTITVKIENGTAADYSTDPTNGNRWPNIEPVYSYDNVNWYRLPLSGVTFNRTERTFTMNITVPMGYNKVWLAPLPPYNIAKRDALFAEFASSPYLTVTSLGTTPGGQQLKVATITDPAYPDAGKFRSYVIAQQHAGETPSSWNAEGLIRYLLSDDPTAAAIRRSYIFRIIPIVSVDSVYQGICRYTPVRDGYQYDLNRWWNQNPISSAPFEVRTIYNDIQAFKPHSFNDMHSTINQEQVSPEEALTYRYSTLTTEYTNFMDRIKAGGWPETVRAASTLAGGAFQNVRSRLGVTFSLSWENPHDEISSNRGTKLTVNDWMTWGQGWAKGNYLYFGDAKATLTVTTSGSGTVTKDPDYPTYTYGTSVQLTAIANAGYTFSHWEGDLTGNNNPATILMNGNKTVTAVFIEGGYVLTINVEGGGIVSRNHTGPYHYGSVVQLTAIADPNWEFFEWSGDYTGTDNPTTIIITGNMNITARFTLKQYVINASVIGIGGTIEPSGTVTVFHGEDETFTITPDIGYHVLDVLVDGESQGAISAYTFYAVDMNHTITAFFAPNEYTLTVNVSPEESGAVTLNNTGPYYYGDAVQLTAEPNTGWYFSHWEEDILGSQNPATVTMNSNKSVTAIFTMKQWWRLDWQYRRAITIDRTKVSGTLTGFPVLIDILDSNLIGKTQPNGYDFVFTDANNVKLNHQIEFYDSTTGRLIAWVKVPYLSSTTDTVVYMYYGNPICENQQNPTAVWDANYMLVLHLNENTGIHYDSTINGNNGTPYNGVVQGITRKVDGGDTFDGSNDYVQVADSNTLTGYTQAFTVSFWIRLEDTSRRQTILCKYHTSNNMRGWQIEYDPISCPNNPFWFFASQDGITYSQWWASFIPQANMWYYVTIVWEANAIPKFYINGVQVPTIIGKTFGNPISSIFNNTGSPLQIGRSAYAGRYFKGALDEICISNIARSADWISTAYTNQLNPSLFYTVGTEETF